MSIQINSIEITLELYQKLMNSGFNFNNLKEYLKNLVNKEIERIHTNAEESENNKVPESKDINPPESIESRRPISQQELLDAAKRWKRK